MNEKKQYPCIKVLQNMHQKPFYLFAMEANDLLKIATVSRRHEDRVKGIQRALNITRCSQISDYVKDNNPITNNILLNFNKGLRFISEEAQDSDSVEAGKIEITFEPNIAFVLDGQHRLFAFDNESLEKCNNSAPESIPLTIVAYEKLTDQESADLFIDINSNQVNVPPSLIYDLIPLSREEETYKQSRSRELIRALSEDSDSALRDRIFIDGFYRNRKQQPLTLIEVSRHISGYLSESDGVLGTRKEFSDTSIQERLLKNYFNAFYELVGKQDWYMNTKAIFTRSAGMKALFIMFPTIVDKIKDNNYKIEGFKAVIESINRSLFVYDQQKYKGVTNYNKIADEIAKEIIQSINNKIAQSCDDLQI